jgi:hypothetical protein
MHPDELTAPLGRGKSQKKRTLPVLIGVLSLFGLALGGWALYVDNPLGSLLVAVEATLPAQQTDAATASIKPVTNQNDSEPLTRTAAAKQVPPPDAKTITIIDGSNGQQQDVIIPTPGLAQPVAR